MPVRPWLYGIAANLARHHWRDEERMLRAYARTGIDPVLAENDDALDRLGARSRQRELATARKPASERAGDSAVARLG